MDTQRAGSRDGGTDTGNGNNGNRNGNRTGADTPETGAVSKSMARARSSPQKPNFVFLGPRSGHSGEVATTFGLQQLLDSSAEVLGNGSFGMSYKTFINNREEGQVVIVKRLKQPVLHPKEFVRNVETLGVVPLQPSFVAHPSLPRRQ